jgi:hypothetical protein
MLPARARLESLLKDRQLDVTLTSASPLAPTSADALASADLAPTGDAAIDRALGGGLRRGHLSEIVGPRSTGRSAVACRALAEAAGRGELVALVDACDRFDPPSAAASGLDLSRLLWVRDTGNVARAIKAMNLVLQAGGFGLVVLDLADAPARLVRALPFTTWFRLARVIEGSPTVALLLAAEHLARSSGGATLDMLDRLDMLDMLDMDDRSEAPRPRPGDVPALAAARARWVGGSDRARLLHGLETHARVVGARR